MKPRSELTDEEFRELVLKARQMPPEEKLLAGMRRFQEEEAELKAQFLAKYPNESPEQIFQRVSDHYETLRAAEPNPYVILSDEEAAKYL